MIFEYFLPSYVGLSSETINQGFTGLKQSQLKYIVSSSFGFSFLLRVWGGLGEGRLVD